MNAKKAALTAGFKGLDCIATVTLFALDMTAAHINYLFLMIDTLALDIEQDTKMCRT